MLIIPAHHPNGDFDLLIVLEQENIDRIKEYDPAELKWNELGYFSDVKPRSIQITFGSPEDIKKIHELAKVGKPVEAIKLVTRGWKFRPESGDHDFGPVSLIKKLN